MKGDKVRYLCLSCMRPDNSDDNGNCSCGADNWLEPRDFTHNQDFVEKVARGKELRVQDLKWYFELEVDYIGVHNRAYRHPVTGSWHSFPR